MLEIIAVRGKLLGSNVVGSAIGWLGGLLNRRLDLQVKQLELEDRDRARAHEVTMRKVDVELMQAEAASKERVASIEATGKVQVAEWQSLSESYRQEASIPEGSLAKNVRPLLTLILGTAGITQAGALLWVAFAVYRVEFSGQQMHELVQYCVAWVFFQAGLVIGWWFANRPGKAPELRWRS
jgi:hypothetical protein